MKRALKLHNKFKKIPAAMKKRPCDEPGCYTTRHLGLQEKWGYQPMWFQEVKKGFKEVKEGKIQGRLDT